MAGTETKRIIELTEASTVQSGDFIAVDSNARGTKKVPTSALATSAALTAETNARAGADEQMSERMDGIEEQTALIQNPTKTLSGALVSFTDGADMPMVACTAEIVPQQSGSGTPSPENVRPISGWESVSLYKSGKNIYNGESQIIIDKPITRGTTIYIQIFDGTFMGSTLYAKTTTADWAEIGAITRTKNAITINRDDILQIKLSSSAYSDLNNAGSHLMASFTDFDTYAPYTGTTTTVNLGRTVYGGTLDVVSGELTAYPFYPSYNGETLDGRWICDRAVYAEGTTPPTGSQVALISGTSTTYQLTPTEIQTLLGENNVWADSGDVEITYRRDISIVINNLESALNG